MKKATGIIFLLVVFAFPVFAQTSNINWAENDLKGKVKAVNVTAKYRNIDGNKIGKWQHSASYKTTFDEKGNSIERIDFKEDGSVYYTSVYAQDSNSRIIEITVTWGDGKYAGKTTFAYDSEGNMVEEIHYKPDGSIPVKYVNSYDVKGNLIETNYFTNEKKYTNKIVRKYDSNGNMVQVKSIYDPEEKNWTAFNFTYDDKGNKISETMSHRDGPGAHKTSYKYDDKGNMTEQINTGVPAFVAHILWNYEYDKAGNWIKRSQLGSNGVPGNIEERVIEYY